MAALEMAALEMAALEMAANVQAGVAARGRPWAGGGQGGRPEEARAALLAIKEASRSSDQGGQPVVAAPQAC